MQASRILWFCDAWLGACRVQDFGLGAPRVESFDGRHRASDAGLSPSGGLGQPRARTKGLIPLPTRTSRQQTSVCGSVL